jgi:hypothetical protein
LAGPEIRVDDRAAGNRNLLASQAVQTVLVEVYPNLNNLVVLGLIAPPSGTFTGDCVDGLLLSN